MKRLALGLVVVLAFSGLPVQADYLQWGVDAARTGLTLDLGPVRDDVAFEVEMPGFVDWSHPLIIDGSVYADIRNFPFSGADTRPDMLQGIVRADLDSAELQVIREFEKIPFGMVSDGQRLIVAKEYEVAAYPLDGGEALWVEPWEPRVELQEAFMSCAMPALDRGTVYVLCLESGMIPHENVPGVYEGSTITLGEQVARLRALDVVTGEDRWESGGIVVSSPGGTGLLEVGHQLAFKAMEGVSVVGDLVVVVTMQAAPHRAGEVRVEAFSSEAGEGVWRCTRSLPEQEMERIGANPALVTFPPQVFQRSLPATGGDDEVYFIAGNLYGVAAEGGSGMLSDCQNLWTVPIQQERSVSWGALAIDGDALYVASGGMVSSFDRVQRTLSWSRSLPEAESVSRDVLVVGGDILYSATMPASNVDDVDPFNPESFVSTTGEHHLYARDKATGDVLWRHMAPNAFDYAVGAGVAVLLLGNSGSPQTLRVVGSTPASLQPVLVVSSEFPESGESVEVDLSHSRPGVHGEATLFRARWGDGTLTPWQEDPLFTHTFRTDGVYFAEFQVGNDAGQTATTTMTFHVGADPPKDLNFLQTVFAPDNQNMTFGVLGIMVAMSIAVLGVVHQKQRRGRLQREIDAADAVYEEGKNEPLACQRALKERKMLARGLVVDGKLEEAQFALLRDHIDGLSRSLRVPLMEEEFAFLPGAMLLSLRKMMEDGRITRFERDKFLEELAKAKGVTKTQKRKVEERLEAWFQEDTGREPK